MQRPIHITAVRNDEPDLDRFVAALAALVLARLDAEDEESQTRTAPEREDGDE